MNTRFVPPAPGASPPVRFPAITRDGLPNGLHVWTIAQPTLPAFTAMLILRRGTADDPADQPGLASLTSDMLDEGAGRRDAIQLADALARMGAELDVDAGPDATTISLRALSRSIEPALALLADVVMRPHLADADFARVRELRVSRLKQLSRSSGTLADRAFATAVFGDHPYAHGALGTTAALQAMVLEDARRFWHQMYGPSSSTLIVGGDVRAAEIFGATRRAFGEWRDTPAAAPVSDVPVPRSSADGRLLFVERPAAPQAELRIGHLGPPRDVDAYHALVTLNAVLGGQFTSRINQRLRQQKGLTYGARTSFEFRARGGVFSCDTSVQANATAEAIDDVLLEFARIRLDEAVEGDELDRAKASLTRGYVRHFETPAQLVRGASQLALYGLDDDTFDRFVDRVEAVTAADVHRAAMAHVRPDAATVVAVGDAEVCGRALEALGRTVTPVAPEF